jgi:hypothetical protein
MAAAKIAGVTSRAAAELPGLHEVFGETIEPIPGEPFKPSDPQDEAASQHPTGLTALLEEDVDGMGSEEALAPRATDSPIIAVDAGVVRLGNTADGILGVARGAAMIHFPDGRRELRKYRPGAIYISSRNRIPLLHRIGTVLGKPDFFVKVDDDGNPTEEKLRAGPHDHRHLDRVRNVLERLIQRDLVDEFQGAIFLFDGALTVRTYDTPGRWLRKLHEDSHDADSSLIGISKKTGLTVRGVDIRLLLDGEGGLPGRRKLTGAVRENGDRDRLLGDLYVARFAPGADTYRVDVAPAPGLRSAQPIDELAGSCLFRHGYPEPLVEAHAFSYMPPAAVVELQANAVVQFELEVKQEPNLGPVFAPFGGRFK